VIVCARNSRHARSLRSTRDGDRHRLSAAHRESEGYASCAYCNDDKTQPGCECFETGYDAARSLSHPAVSDGTSNEGRDGHSGDGSGDGSGNGSGEDDSTDGSSTDWRSLPLDCGAGVGGDTVDVAAGEDIPSDTDFFDEYVPVGMNYPCR